MENLPTYRLTQSGPEAQEILDQVNLNTIDIEQLKRLYQAFNQSDPEIIEPTDTWPVANPEENVIYRVIDRVNTPPQYYTDYMWNGTSMVPMAQYNNAIDNEPTANSNNLVKSGGVYSFVHANGGAYDISAAHAVGGVLATYDDLADALGTNGANVPAAVRKGGMSIKFVLSSDNKYVQYRYMLTDVSTAATFTNVNNWQGVDEEPSSNSQNLVEGGGISNYLFENNAGQLFGGELPSLKTNDNILYGYFDLSGQFVQSSLFATTIIEILKGERFIYSGYMDNDACAVIFSEDKQTWSGGLRGNGSEYLATLTNMSPVNGYVAVTHRKNKKSYFYKRRTSNRINLDDINFFATSRAVYRIYANTIYGSDFEFGSINSETGELVDSTDGSRFRTSNYVYLNKSGVVKGYINYANSFNIRILAYNDNSEIVWNTTFSASSDNFSYNIPTTSGAVKVKVVFLFSTVVDAAGAYALESCVFSPITENESYFDNYLPYKPLLSHQVPSDGSLVVGNKASFVESSTKLATGFIPNDFYVRLANNYLVDACYYFDKDKKFLTMRTYEKESFIPEKSLGEYYIITIKKDEEDSIGYDVALDYDIIEVFNCQDSTISLNDDTAIANNNQAVRKQSLIVDYDSSGYIGTNLTFNSSYRFAVKFVKVKAGDSVETVGYVDNDICALAFTTDKETFIYGVNGRGRNVRAQQKLTALHDGYIAISFYRIKDNYYEIIKSDIRDGSYLPILSHLVPSNLNVGEAPVYEERSNRLATQMIPTKGTVIKLNSGYAIQYCLYYDEDGNYVTYDDHYVGNVCAPDPNVSKYCILNLRKSDSSNIGYVNGVVLDFYCDDSSAVLTNTTVELNDFTALNKNVRIIKYDEFSYVDNSGTIHRNTNNFALKYINVTQGDRVVMQGYCDTDIYALSFTTDKETFTNGVRGTGVVERGTYSLYAPSNGYIVASVRNVGYDNYYQVFPNAQNTPPAYSISDCMTAFMEHMRRKAVVIGMTNSVFNNPYGGSAYGYNSTTVKDLLKLVRYAQGDSKFRAYWSKETVTCKIYGPNERTATFSQNNYSRFDDAYEELHPGQTNPYKIIGVKPGGWTPQDHRVFQFTGILLVDNKEFAVVCANTVYSDGRFRYPKAMVEICDILHQYNQGVDISSMEVTAEYADKYGVMVLPPYSNCYANIEPELIMAKGVNDSINTASTVKTLCVLTVLDIVPELSEMHDIKNDSNELINDSDFIAQAGDIETVETSIWCAMLASNAANTLAVARYAGSKILENKNKWGIS